MGETQGALLGTRKAVRREILIILSIWFLVYVIFDVVSTFWLIENTTIGLAGEQNPLGVLLYRYGFFGVYAGKLLGFIPLSVAAILVDTRYGKVRWVRETVEVVLLLLVGVSLLAALVNFSSIVATLFLVH